MERAYEIAGLWTWLPAFRAVAETQHLPTAAGFMHVTPSALSRSVKQLEEAVGTPLFARGGRRIRLNAAGERLLAAVRDAMRLLDDGLGASRGAPSARLAVAGPSPWIAKLIALLAAARPGIVIDVVEAALDPGPQLLRGEIDVVVCERVGVDGRFAVDLIGELRRSVWCSATHPLGKSRRVPADRLAAHAFAATDTDGWPPERPRRVELRSGRLEVVIDGCKSGHYLAVLPSMLARDAGLRDLGVRVPGGGLYVQRRQPVTAGPDWMLEAIRGSLRFKQR
jgi:DNA-binding transcriptional LysR family regulator